MIGLRVALLSARVELQSRIDTMPSSACLSYCRTNGITMAKVGGWIGTFGVVPMADHGNGRFEFASGGDDGFCFEAFGEDGESVVDIVGWKLNQPHRPMTLFGRCGLLGLWQAMAPASCYWGTALPIHQTALSWLQSGCNGAAIITPCIAARQLLDVPVPIQADSVKQGRALMALLQSNIPRNKIVVPEPSRSWPS